MKRTDLNHGVTGLCLSPVDLAVSKLVAGREKDLDFVAAMLRHRMVAEGEIRTALLELDQRHVELAQRRLQCLVRPGPPHSAGQ